MTSWDGGAFRERLQRVLDGFLDEMAGRVAPLGPDAAALLEEARRSVSGGKRFRAAFCWWGYRAFQPQVEDEEALLRACADLELLHASALVHDDVMDGSSTRRGRPATHVGFAARHARESLTGYKVPRRYVVLDELPVNAMGKVLRREVVREIRGR